VHESRTDRAKPVRRADLPAAILARMPALHRRARRGMTLVELLAMLAVAALLAALAGRSAVQLRDALLVRQTARTLAGAFAAARATALAQDTVALLLVTPGLVQVRQSGDTLDALRAVLRDVDSVEGAPRVHRFAPDGLMLDAGNATYVLRRGAAARRVIIAKYGRVRIE
jgi:hypothetical protein